MSHVGMETIPRVASSYMLLASFSTYNEVILSPTLTHVHIMAIRINRFYLSVT